MNAADRLLGWTPFRAASYDDTVAVDWCHLGTRRMVEPFFYETILHAMREPFNLAFQQRTPIEALAELPHGLPVAGFIFHMSRCGSTLISQALAALGSNIVVAEASPLRSALRAASSSGPNAAARWFAGLVNAYAQRRFAAESRLFVKLMAADVFDIALVRRAFPDVPWVFAIRDPAEIMASQAASPGIDLVRGQIAASRLGLAEDRVWTMTSTIYQAHVMAAFARAGLDALASGRGLVLDHADLPEALWTTLPTHFGLDMSPDAIDAMRAVSRRHSKSPGRAFQREEDPNRAEAAPFRSIVEPITGPVMAALSARTRNPS